MSENTQQETVTAEQIEKDFSAYYDVNIDIEVNPIPNTCLFDFSLKLNNAKGRSVFLVLHALKELQKKYEEARQEFESDKEKYNQYLWELESNKHQWSNLSMLIDEFEKEIDKKKVALY